MIIILEGPDGGGKTTLSEYIRQHMSDGRMTHVIKHGPYTGLTSEELCKTFFRSMSAAITYNDHIIMDRSWLSEPIYGQVYRNGLNRVDVQRRRMLERVALSRGAVVIQCQPEFDVCCSAFLSRQNQEYLDTPEQLQEVYNAYETLGMQTHLPVIHYDYTQDNPDDILAKALRVSIENFHTGGGSFRQGNYLFLCDKGPQANMKNNTVIVPFINFNDTDGPSRMLAATLEKEGVAESDCYWANTQLPNGKPATTEFIAKLKPKKIFAIGNNAYSWSLKNGIKAQKLPPPLFHMHNFPDQPYNITQADYGNF